MYKLFDNIENLYREIEIDKYWTGAESSLRNRYPLRFVLFEKFNDFYAFVQECQTHNVFVQSMEMWMTEDNDDQLMTYSHLASQFELYIKNIPANDFVIAPFSEITRFYDNECDAEFDSLIKTIRLINASSEAQEGHQRIYIPIIGMQNKMTKFKEDPNIYLWELRSTNEGLRYKLILSKGGTYGVCGLDGYYSICHNMREWIALWKVGFKVHRHIICTSATIYNNAHHAQPDNAFEYVTCSNAFEFLTNGLNLGIAPTEYKPEESWAWQQLAADVDVSDFSFDTYVSQKFNAFSLNDEKDFVQAWFDNNDDYSRWLLKTYYIIKDSDQTYLTRVLKKCSSQSTSELFSLIATQIFEEPIQESALCQRSVMLCEASVHHVNITEMAEQILLAKIKAIATDPMYGYEHAMKYMSPLTGSERDLMIEWLGEGYIHREDVKFLFPQLYHYVTNINLNLDSSNLWINKYFNEYRKSKLANVPTDELRKMINEKNASPSTFILWRDSFKTVKTILHNRKDIDVYYWIDGLGVDWLPYVIGLIEKHKVDGVYLNEIYVATAKTPTCTSNNKIALMELSGNNLKKIGDLDSFAHSPKQYPAYITKEFYIVEQSISTILAQYNGKKIAFISDHGISYMPQTGNGLNYAAAESDHFGRCATWKNEHIPQDNKYVEADDGKTICSLTYDSLTSKTPSGQGAHGGATPEEVLVPIIIVSNQKNASKYSVKLIENEVSATQPIVKYKIKGLSSIDQPLVEYNGAKYCLHMVGNDIYDSEKIHLVETIKKITIIINEFKQTDTIIIKTGVDEEDLFKDI